jgi:shikimate kinase
MTISEIFARDGEAFFREKETQVIDRLLKSRPCILSTGGGAFLHERNRALIAQSGIAVWLRADLDLLWARVRQKTTRPLLRTANPRATLTELHEARVPEYAKAEVIVDAKPDQSIDETAARVIKALLTRSDVLETIR